MTVYLAFYLTSGILSDMSSNTLSGILAVYVAVLTYNYCDILCRVRRAPEAWIYDSNASTGVHGTNGLWHSS